MAGLRSYAWGGQFRNLPPIARVHNFSTISISISIQLLPLLFHFSSLLFFWLCIVGCIQRNHGFRCCSTSPKRKNEETQTPELLKIAVSGVTEILRLFIPAGRGKTDLVDDEREGEVSVTNVDEVLSVIRSDYEKAYFVTGSFTTSIYAEECIFEDPTIKFKGKQLYARNLSLLLPFFEKPSIQLKELKKDLDCETISIVASWKLRTYIRLPWRPLICIDGTTTYELDEEFRIERHVEKWSVTALEAILQIFTPGSENPRQ